MPSDEAHTQNTRARHAVPIEARREIRGNGKEQRTRKQPPPCRGRGVARAVPPYSINVTFFLLRAGLRASFIGRTTAEKAPWLSRYPGGRWPHRLIISLYIVRIGYTPPVLSCHLPHA